MTPCSLVEVCDVQHEPVASTIRVHNEEIKSFLNLRYIYISLNGVTHHTDTIIPLPFRFVPFPIRQFSPLSVKAK